MGYKSGCTEPCHSLKTASRNRSRRSSCKVLNWPKNSDVVEKFTVSVRSLDICVIIYVPDNQVTCQLEQKITWRSSFLQESAASRIAQSKEYISIRYMVECEQPALKTEPMRYVNQKIPQNI